MSTGDSADILKRIKLVLPKAWWAWVAPLRDAVLGALADRAAWCYGWYTYAKAQTRIATATGPWLDIVAYDFLGRYLARMGSSDSIFRQRILATILQERVTRKGMISMLTNLTGRTPAVIEPWNTGDCGAWNNGTFAFGASGCWGSINLPGQFFLTVYRGNLFAGVPNVGGWSTGLGGYNTGAIPWIGSSTAQVGVTDSDIYNAIVNTKPTGTVAWTKLA